MSEAKNLPDVPDQPAATTQPAPEVFAEKIPAVSGQPRDLHNDTSELRGPETRGPAFTEKAASFILKTFLLAAACFAMGATFTVLILMDLLDHKSGWLKELLQFIKETSKIVIK